MRRLSLLLPLAGLVASASVLLSGGCASYQLGSATAELPYRAIYVAPPRNETNLPQLEAPMAVALRHAIASDTATPKS